MGRLKDFVSPVIFYLFLDYFVLLKNLLIVPYFINI